jgi:flap endonuclease-1
MVQQTMELLKLLGMPVVQAPGDGEAQASFMCGNGDAYAVSSQDFDSLLFGCPLLVRNLGVTGRRKMPGRNRYYSVDTEVIPLEESLKQMGISRNQLVDMAILMGTDFNEGVKGIGPKKALKLIREFGDLETATRENRIPLVEYEEIRRIFLEPSITRDYEIGFSKPDHDGVLSMLVDGFGFASDGVLRNLEMISGSYISVEENHQTSLDKFL